MQSAPDHPTSSIDALKSILGAKRFLRFVKALESDIGRPLRSWQTRALDAVDPTLKPPLPRANRELLELLASHLPPPPSLDPSEVPDWIRIDSLGGVAPVQGDGAVVPGGYWYFRARYNGWSLEVWTGGPDDGYPGDPSNSLHYENYGHLDFDASYMPINTALYFIVYALTRWRNGDPPPHLPP